MRFPIITLSLLSAISAVAAAPQTGSGEADGYKLVWQDLFDDGQLNRDRWNVEVVSRPANNELQFYLDNEKNVRVGDDGQGNGCLILTAIREDHNGRKFTSGRINSTKKVAFTHGKIEAAIKLPSTADGLWPAFWMMGDDYQEVGWPRCGEIDIMEFGHQDGMRRNEQDRYFNGACHWGFYNEQNQYPNYANAVSWDYSLQDGEFHLFTCIWDEEYISMYCDLDRYPDREPYYRIGVTETGDDWGTGLYFHKPCFILFNLAVGGHFPGITNADKITALNEANSQQASMYVNYVKVYQKENNINAPDNGDVEKEPAGIASVESTDDAPVEYFNIQGMPVSNPRPGSIVIERRGAEVRKIVL